MSASGGAARFAAGYRWRMAWGVALTGALLAALFWGLGQLYPHVFLTEWAGWGCSGAACDGGGREARRRAAKGMAISSRIPTV